MVRSLFLPTMSAPLLMNDALYDTTVVRLDSPTQLPDLYFVYIGQDSWICCRFYAFRLVDKQFTNLPVVFQIHGKISAHKSSLTNSSGAHGIEQNGEPPLSSCWIEEVEGQPDGTWERTYRRLLQVSQKSGTDLDMSLLIKDRDNADLEPSLRMLQVFWCKMNGVSYILHITS
jgi:hypothetical protein